MCSREGDNTANSAPARRRLLTLTDAPCGVLFRVARIARPTQLDGRTWRGSLLRLVELGIFPGQTVEKTGILGPLGAVVVKAGGSRVAISRDLAAVVLVRLVPPHAGGVR